MSNFDLFVDNFYSMVVILSKAPKGSMLNISSALIATSGLPFRDENFLIFNSIANAIHIDCALGLMPSYSVPFSVPILPGTDPFVPAFLNATFKGCEESVHEVMALPKCDDLSFDPSCEVVDDSNVRDFIDVVWRGFESEGEVSEDYVNFVMYLYSLPLTKLFILRDDEGNAVSSALLFDSGSSCGLYYFATLPDCRRKGFAKRLLSSVATVAFERYDSLLLLATDSGVPFYSAVGFESLGTVPVWTCPNNGN